MGGEQGRGRGQGERGQELIEDKFVKCSGLVCFYGILQSKHGQRSNLTCITNRSLRSPCAQPNNVRSPQCRRLLLLQPAPCTRYTNELYKKHVLQLKSLAFTNNASYHLHLSFFQKKKKSFYYLCRPVAF